MNTPVLVPHWQCSYPVAWVISGQDRIVFRIASVRAPYSCHVRKVPCGGMDGVDVNKTDAFVSDGAQLHLKQAQMTWSSLTTLSSRTGVARGE